MGHISCRASCCSPNPDPNPENFVVLGVKQFDNYCVLRILYPNCTTYEGEKIMVYKALGRDIISQQEIDPHFLEQGLCPIARFPANKQGLDDAVRFATMKAKEE